MVETHEKLLSLNVTKKTVDDLISICSEQSLAQQPPCLLGGMELGSTMYACTGYESVEGHSIAWGYEIVETDKFTGSTRSDFNAVPNGTGFKATYKDKEYVLVGERIKFMPLLEETPTPPRRRRRTKAEIEAENKAKEHPSES